MESSIPEEVLCPICFEFPMKEIYQCSNGHIVCDICADGLSECPQCRVKFETNKIRNRVLESLLDTMTIECSNKGVGCTVKDTRKNISSHMEACSVRQTTVSICEHLGFQCGFMVNPKMCLESIEHFRNEHHFIQSEHPVVLISLEGVMELVRNQCSLWKPAVIISDSTLGVTLLIVIRYNEDDQTISFICLELDDRESHAESAEELIQVEFRIKAMQSTETPDLIWTSPTVNIKHAINAIKYPQFSFKLSHLTTQYVLEGSLRVKCSVSRIRPTVVKVESAATIYLLHSPCEVITSPSAPPPSPPLNSRREKGQNESGASALSSSYSLEVRVESPQPSRRTRHRRKPAPIVAQNIPSLSPDLEQALLSVSGASRNNPQHQASVSSNNFLNPQSYQAHPGSSMRRVSGIKIVVFKSLCNACGAKPTCMFYHCLQCANYDLCQACMQKGEHDQHIFAVVSSKKQQSALSKIFRASKQWKPFFPAPLVGNESERSLAQNVNLACSACKGMVSKICIQCHPLVGFCDPCFETNSGFHWKDHFFAVAKNPTELQLMLDNWPKFG